MADTFNLIFIGRSGSGKGTQSELMKSYLEGKYGHGSVFYFTTGDCFRNLQDQPDLDTGRLVSAKILKAGAKGPDFLTIWCWAKEFIHCVEPSHHVILDGTPRTTLEAQTLDEMFSFYDREKVFPVFLNVSDNWAYDKLIKRGRQDDKPEIIKSRLAYYPIYVEPTIKYYIETSKNKLIKINGEQSIGEVHNDVVKSFGL